MQINKTSTLGYLQIIFFSAVILFFGKILFIPLFLGLLIAIIFYPVVKWLEMHRWNKVLAITVCLLMVTALLSGLFALLVWQVNVFIKDMPAIVTEIGTGMRQFQAWVVKPGSASLMAL